MIYSIYDQTTGQILRIVNTININLQLRNNESYIEGSYHDENYYIADNEPVEISEKPNEYAEFDFTTKQWAVNSQLAEKIIKVKRNQLLVTSDWTDTLSAKTRLGDELYNQWQTYRQELRDITNQPGYPLNVVWPTRPGSAQTS
jgi:hypothetical protein